MANQFEKCNVKNTLLWDEECQKDYLANVKLDISETSITVSNSEFKNHLLPDEIKQYNISTTLDNIKTEMVSSDVQYDNIRSNLKTDEGISPNDIKIEFNNGFLYCEECHVYCEDYCADCDMLVHILNRTVPIGSDDTLQEELPHDHILKIQDNFGEFHTIALKAIPAGVKFGPFTGLNRTDSSWKIKGGKFVVNKGESSYLNWMQYINPARNISEQNLLACQHEHNLYYQSTRQIQEGDELLVYFGEEYEDSLNRNVEMDFVPTTEHIFKDVFACILCCLGFSSKSYLVKHKIICPANANREFSIKELAQCPSCKIYLDQKEYTMHHMAYCCERNDRKCILLTPGNRTVQANVCKTRPRLIYKCLQCKYRTKYKVDLKNHTNLHYEVKTYKCGVCSRRFKTKQVLRSHVENIHTCAGGKEDLEHSSADYMKAHIKAEQSCAQEETKQFNFALRESQPKYKTSFKRQTEGKHLKQFKHKCGTCEYKTYQKSHLKRHIQGKHLKEFKYKCDTCGYKTNEKDNLKKHIEARHLKKFKYQCDICEYKANYKSNLEKHIMGIHLNEFKYKCAVCEYKTNREYDLKKHIEGRHTKEFKYKCDMCDYKAIQKSDLKRHIEAKHLKYMCHVCEYTTNQKPNLKRHVEARHLEFKYKCDICECKVIHKSDLKRHIEAKHLKQLKYMCDACEYKTSRKSDLKRHVEAKHLKEFKYKCDVCEYKIIQKFDLKRHTQAKHLKELKYTCDTCEYKTNVKRNLMRHMEEKHFSFIKEKFKYTCVRLSNVRNPT